MRKKEHERKNRIRHNCGYCEDVHRVWEYAKDDGEEEEKRDMELNR